MPSQLRANATRPWEISGDRLRIGGRLIDCAEIAGVRHLAGAEYDRAGGTLVAVIFCLCLWFLVFGVFQLGWRMRFLVGAATCLLLAATGIEDVWRATRITVHEVEIALRSGHRVRFTTAEAAEAAALAAALQGRGTRGITG